MSRLYAKNSAIAQDGSVLRSWCIVDADLESTVSKCLGGGGKAATLLTWRSFYSYMNLLQGTTATRLINSGGLVSQSGNKADRKDNENLPSV